MEVSILCQRKGEKIMAKKKRKSAKGKTKGGKRVGFFKSKGRCFRRLKSGKVKFAKKSACK